MPPPDYPTDDVADPSPRFTGPHWASYLPDPKRFDLSREVPITPAFATTRRHRQRVDPDGSRPTSSVFGPRHLANPYSPYTAASPMMRRRFLEYGVNRPYSPDIDALSLESSATTRSQAYMGQSYNYSAISSGATTSTMQQQHNSQTIDAHEEIKFSAEKDSIDKWNHYS